MGLTGIAIVTGASREIGQTIDYIDTLELSRTG